MKIDIKQTIERSNRGDILKLEFDDFQYYIKIHIKDDYNIDYELRRGDSNEEDGVAYVHKSLEAAVEAGKKEIYAKSRDHLMNHYGVIINE